MNEQIKQLAAQADEYCRDYVPNWNMNDYNKKFAELIILECDRYARSTWEHGHLLGGDLKRLFGFEDEE